MTDSQTTRSYVSVDDEHYTSVPDYNRQCPDTPEKPKTLASRHVYKQHDNSWAIEGRKPQKMRRSEADDSLAVELESAVFTVDDVASKAIPEPFDLDVILEKLTFTPGTAHVNNVIHKYLGETRRWMPWPKTHIKEKEKELGNYLNKVADEVRRLLGRKKSRNDLVFSHQYRYKGPKTDYTTQRKPDLVVVPRSEKRSGSLRWADFRSTVSLKVGSQSQKDERVQLSEYARLCFKEQYDRRYFIAFGLRDTKLTFYVFDRAGVLHTKEHDVHAEPTVFLRVAISILFLDEASLGYDPSFSVTKKGKRCVTAQDKSYIIAHKIHTDCSIRGRGTVVLKVKEPQVKGRVYVVKDSWVDRSRTVKEFEILSMLKEFKIKNVPELIAHEVVDVDDGTGQRVMDSTERFRGPDFRGVEIRDHHRIVMFPWGQPLKSFTSLGELVSAMRDVLQTIRDLNKRGILHRDISIGNILLVDDGPGFRKGYLIDYDYAIMNETNRLVSKGKRTGTVPFMACDVLAKRCEHTVLHDAESTLYILIWLAFTQAGPNGTERMADKSYDWETTILRIWNPLGILDEQALIRVAGAKRAVMLDDVQFEETILEKMHVYFKPIGRLLQILCRILFPPQQTQKTASWTSPMDLKDFIRNKPTTKTELPLPDPDTELGHMIAVFDAFLEVLESDDVGGASTSGEPLEGDDVQVVTTNKFSALNGTQHQSTEDITRVDISPFNATTDEEDHSLTKLVGNTKLRYRLKKEAVRPDAPAKKEALAIMVLRSEAKRSRATEDDPIVRGSNPSSHKRSRG